MNQEQLYNAVLAALQRGGEHTKEQAAIAIDWALQAHTVATLLQQIMDGELSIMVDNGEVVFLDGNEERCATCDGVRKLCYICEEPLSGEIIYPHHVDCTNFMHTVKGIDVEPCNCKETYAIHKDCEFFWLEQQIQFSVSNYLPEEYKEILRRGLRLKREAVTNA